ncbi:MAG: DUF559 domain-containing protein [Alphaproteobacteria bacterium]|jgi:very-short-patch-repair endonuclease|nr:DUF559 domain-containing protein [Alphaproteobacteria bacterium]
MPRQRPPDPPVTRARRLRQSASYPETRAWQTLRRLRAHGFPVRRQHPLAGYTVDFAIARARLVIEVDGPAHQGETQQMEDAARDRALEARGWQVLRVDTETACDADALWALVCERLGL